MIQKIKNYVIIILILISLIGVVVSYITIKSNRSLRDNWSVSENNYKASNKKNLAYQISLEQMKLSSDSLDKILIEFKNKNNQIERDNSVLDMFTNNLSDAQLARIARNKQFIADYNHMISPQSNANNDMNEWVRVMVAKMKTDIKLFSKKPLNDYLK